MDSPIKNEHGFILMTSLMMLVILMIIGIAATNTTTIELIMTGNDKAAKQTFYGADSGMQVSTQLIEDCMANDLDSSTRGAVHINDLDLCQNVVGDSSVVAYFPNSGSATVVPRTDISTGGTTEILAGGAIQMVAGYEGRGKSAAQGGTVRHFTADSHHIGESNSDTTIRIQWDSRL